MRERNVYLSQFLEGAAENAARNPGGAAKWILGGLLVFIALISAVCSYKPIESGHVGVVYQFSKIIGEIQPGANFLPPWQSVTVQNVQIQNAKFRDATTPEEKKNPVDFLGHITAASNQSQDVFFDVTLNWTLDQDKVMNLYTTLGPSFFEKLVPSRMNQYFKAETVKYEATDALQKREKIRTDVTAALSDDLGKYGIRVVSLQIDNIDFNGDFSAAILKKQIATQDAQAAANRVAIEKANADIAVAQAKGRADSAIEAARGDAESIRIKAQAQADANLKISSSLTDQLIRSKAVENLTGIKGYILPAGGNFLFDPTTALTGIK